MKRAILMVVILLMLAQASSAFVDADAQSAALILIGAGDISSCALDGDRLTADLIMAEIDSAVQAGQKITVFTTGDNVYPAGTAEEFAACYEPTWGRFKKLTRPALGNHDYATRGARPYFEYFGDNVPGSYYSYYLGEWLIVVLNSNIDARAGESAQSLWLRDQLTAHKGRCTLAYFHHPLFASLFKQYNRPRDIKAIWDVLYEHGVEVVINGDIHAYERFAPMSPGGNPDAERGIRQFIVGTGGASLNKPPRAIHPNSEARSNQTWGVIKFTLNANSYDWQFIPVTGSAFTDAGTASCF
jgi:hypothetical protein